MPAVALPAAVFLGGAVFIIAAMMSQTVLTPYYRAFCPDTGPCEPRDVEFAAATRLVFALMGAAAIHLLAASGLAPLAWAAVAAAFAALVYSMKIHAIV